MFEQRRVWRIAIFSLELFIIRRTPRHAVSFTHFSSGLISLYKSFSLWNSHKAIFKMEIILLLLGNKQGDSEQHGCFSLVLFTPPHSTLPIQSSNKHTAVQQGRRLMKASTHFYSGVSHLYIKRVGHVISTHPTHTLSLKTILYF